jgi:hypothetical protein
MVAAEENIWTQEGRVGENYIMRDFITCTLHQIEWGCQEGWDGQGMYHARNKNTYSALVGKPERKRPLETPRCRWKNNIQLGLREIG